MTSHPPFHHRQLTVLICAAILCINRISDATTPAPTQNGMTTPSTSSLVTSSIYSTTANPSDRNSTTTNGTVGLNEATATEYMTSTVDTGTLGDGTYEYSTMTQSTLIDAEASGLSTDSKTTLPSDGTNVHDVTTATFHVYVTTDTIGEATIEQTTEVTESTTDNDNSLTTIVEYSTVSSTDVVTDFDTNTDTFEMTSLDGRGYETNEATTFIMTATMHDKSVTEISLNTETNDVVTQLQMQTIINEMTREIGTNSAGAESSYVTTTSTSRQTNNGDITVTEINYAKYTEEFVTEIVKTVTTSNLDDMIIVSKLTQTENTDNTLPDQIKKLPQTTSNNMLTTMTPKQSTTTMVVDLKENYLFFQLNIDESVNITDASFVAGLENGLAESVSSTTNVENASVRRKRFSRFERMLHHTLLRHRRATFGDVTVQIHNLTRNQVDPTIVDTYFTVEINGTVLSSQEAASTFTDMSTSKLSATLGHEVITVPAPANLVEPTATTTIKLDAPTGDLQDFLMIILLVPLNVDITDAAFQTDISNGIEALYLAGLTSSRRKRRSNLVMSDGRIIHDTENDMTRLERDVNDFVDYRKSKFKSLRTRRQKIRTFLDGRLQQNTRQENSRYRRQVIDDPSQEYSVNLKSVNRPKPTEMEVKIVFGVLKNGQVLMGMYALSHLEKLSLQFMTTVLGYQVKEPGVTIFDNSLIDHTLWLIIIADVAVVVILLLMLLIYCLCKKNNKAEVHKQSIMSKMDRSTSIEMGFVRIGVQTSDQMAIQEAMVREKSGAHVMHGTVRDKLTRKRQRKHGISNKQTNMNIDSSSDEESQNVRPSQLFTQENRVHPSDTAALVLHSGNDGEYSKEEYVPKFKKKEYDENMRRQQQLQAQLNKEMASRLGTIKNERSGLQQQMEDLIEGASNFNIADRRSESSKRKKKKTRRMIYDQNDSKNRSVEASEKPRRNRKMKSLAVDQIVPMTVTRQTSMRTPSKNSSNESRRTLESNNNTAVEINQQEIYQELHRKWKKERKRMNTFLDDAFLITTSLLNTSSEQSHVTHLRLPTGLPPIRQTPLTVPPMEPNPYVYNHSLGPAYYRPLPNVIEDQHDYSKSDLHDQNRQDSEKEERSKNIHELSGGERRMKNKVDWTNSMKTVQPEIRQNKPVSSKTKSLEREKRRQEFVSC